MEKNRNSPGRRTQMNPLIVQGKLSGRRTGRCSAGIASRETASRRLPFSVPVGCASCRFALSGRRGRAQEGHNVLQREWDIFYAQLWTFDALKSHNPLISLFQYVNKSTWLLPSVHIGHSTLLKSNSIP